MINKMSRLSLFKNPADFIYFNKGNSNFSANLIVVFLTDLTL